MKNPSGRRLLARGAGGVVIAGSFEQHYADVNGYWLQTDAVLDGTWHSSVLSRKRHGVWRYRLVDMRIVSPDVDRLCQVVAIKLRFAGRRRLRSAPQRR